MNPAPAETIGFLAAAMTAMAVSCRRIVLLRIAAILANILFIACAA